MTEQHTVSPEILLYSVYTSPETDILIQCYDQSNLDYTAHQRYRHLQMGTAFTPKTLRTHGQCSGGDALGVRQLRFYTEYSVDIIESKRDTGFHFEEFTANN